MRHLVLVIAGLVPVYSALAQSPPQSPPQTWFDWQQATGDWGGLRTDLKNAGIVVNAHYLAEISGNPVGGAEQGGTYAHEFMLGVDVDSKVLGWSDGTFHVQLTERAGSSLSKDKIGNILTVQEIYGDGQTVRVTQLSYEQKLFGGLVDVEAGHINTENDFATSPVYFGESLWCEFQNNGICGTPIAAPINSAGYVAYPASSWGARVKLYPLKHWYLEAGAYEVNSTLFLATNGWKLGASGAQGVATFVETGTVIGEQSGWIGNYRVGAYYDNSDNKSVTSQISRYLPKDSPVLASLPFAERAGRYGGWVLADQMIALDPNDHKRGTAIFAALEWGDKATSFVNWYGEAGLVRHGTFAGRESDTAALGFAAASINGSVGALAAELQRQGVAVPGSAQEFMVEANYGATVTPWLNLRPGVQYIWHPKGEAEIHNALVLDTRVVVTF